MEFLMAIVIGGVIGWLASLLMGTSRQLGILANIVVGIVGAAVGHELAPRLGTVASDSVGQWLVSIRGAVLLTLALKVLGIYR